jgi:hypothetical protein
MSARRVVINDAGVRGLERSVLVFAWMKAVREILLGMVGAASDAKLDQMGDHDKRLTRACQLPAMSTCPAAFMSAKITLEIWK